MSDILVLAVLARTLIDVAPDLSRTTWVLAAGVLALAAGLGGGWLLRPWLTLFALMLWLFGESAQHPHLAGDFSLLVLTLLIGYLIGEYLRLTTLALPAAAILAVVGLAALNVAAQPVVAASSPGYASCKAAWPASSG